MAFDAQGHRLGRGRGYYDRFLAQAADVYKLGLCFPFQLVEAVPCEATDVAMDRVECGPVQSYRPRPQKSPFKAPHHQKATRPPLL